MIQLILTVGVPSSGKSTWAKQKVAEDPSNWVRVNNDDLRQSFNGSHFTNDYEKLIKSTREFIVLQALKSGKNVIVDNLNLGKRNFEDYCKLAQSSGKQVKVFEKSFYVELSEAIKRDSERTGSAKVGPEVIGKWWKTSGGKQHKLYVCREEVFVKTFEPISYSETEGLPNCAIFDLDGTMANISHRSPYDASNCNKDKPNLHVVNFAKLLHENGHTIFFFSGREDKHKAMTEEWLDKHFGKSYSLHMRETENFEKDVLLKDRLFKTHVANKYNCKAWVDDRLQIARYVYDMGLPLFRVGDPESNF